ncbi:proline racemase family protein [Paramicrobacterium chengjingii]|uniref:Proline racemase family protein n=1 Tax=Paramicrobacterium chengjingii TaxID=2769067 RepID=A0ABX6YF42_9MICO|nr:proline racemase family protein [Microbacterium chengjingii]QPZ37020.1 proline racemase family protein [Microbacterium chengjingii]
MADSTATATGATTKEDRMINLEIVDAEAGGDIGRVIVAGFETPPGESIAERAEYMRENADWLRRTLIQPPIGELSQSINLVLPPSNEEADIGVITMGTMGYPGFSGSNAMCTIAVLASEGLIDMSADEVNIRLETPVGITALTVCVEDGSVKSVQYAAPVAYAEPEERTATLPTWGAVTYTLAYSGVSYVVVDATTVDLHPTADSAEAIRRLFGELFAEIDSTTILDHPSLGAMPKLTLGLLADGSETQHYATAGQSTPLAVYMAGGVICSGPTGTGTSALLAWLANRKLIWPNSQICAISPGGHTFIGDYTRDTTVGPRSAIHTTITGSPRVLKRDTITIERPGEGSSFGGIATRERHSRSRTHGKNRG